MHERESVCMRVQKIRRGMNVNKQNFTIKLFQIFLRRLKKILAVFLTFCIYKNPVAFLKVGLTAAAAAAATFFSAAASDDK